MSFPNVVGDLMLILIKTYSFRPKMKICLSPGSVLISLLGE